MNSKLCQLTLCSSLLAVLSLASPFAHADKWTAPTKEELAMTSQPEVPGAPAVYLYREETTDDELHMYSIYVRLKVLTERGKEYSNIELPYSSNENGSGISVTQIEGRTIHPDGTIIPFTGKPYDKSIEKTRGFKYMAKVFTLPDVEVGSIIEYRYDRRMGDHFFRAPEWYPQSDLYTRKAYYRWRPTDKQLISNDDRGQLTSNIAWTPILPVGTTLKHTRLPATQMGHDGQLVFELAMQDIPPAPDEEYMPPISSFTYRVLFYYSPYRTREEFWSSEGKHWSKLSDKFIGPGPRVRSTINEIAAPADTQDQKLRKIYAAIMQMENTNFTREHSSIEEKAQGLGEIHTTDDILEHKRGSAKQLTELFVAMARAAGMKAYLATVTSRDHRIFLEAFPNLSQLDDYIAIVNVDGKEQYFDPGSRFCPYKHLAWKHTLASGMRQTDDSGSVIFQTPNESYLFSRVQRVANLTMDEQGTTTGTVKITFTGSPALQWRQSSLIGDATSFEQELRVDTEGVLPNGMDVKVASIDKLQDYEQPLTVVFDVKGAIGSSTGKRLLIPGDIFESNSKPAFPHEKREIPVYFSYPYVAQDAMRVNFPASFHVESLPAAEKNQFQNFAVYAMSSESTPTSVTVRRDYSLGEILFMPKEYTELRTFYSKMETKNQESIVLTTAAASTTPKPAGN
jgi:hypothetical protein